MAKANSFAKRTHWSFQTPFSNRRNDNTEIRLITFFAADDGEALYSQQKQYWELIVAQIMKSLMQKSDLNWRSRENH